MPKIIAKRLRVRRSKDAPWTDLPALVVRKVWAEETDPTVPDWAKQPDKPTYTAKEVGALPADTKIPAKTSDLFNDSGFVGEGTSALKNYYTKDDSYSRGQVDAMVPSKVSSLTNDSGFITKAVGDLVNYYTKSQTYTRDEVQVLVSSIPKFAISVVSFLPTMNISTTTVYLVKSGTGSDMYTEYIYVNGVWEVLGAQRVDLTGYATETWVSIKLADYIRMEDLQVAVDTALAVAKASGEFDGKDGKDGTNGTDGVDGKTPVKSVDYFTPEEVEQIVDEAAEKAAELVSVEVDDTLTKAGQAADAAKVGEVVNQLSETIAEKADGIVETATGDVIAVSDTADAPLRGLTVYGKSVQDGTPTPDAPVPIVSVGDNGTADVLVAGRNMLTFQPQEVVSNGITFQSFDGYITANGTCTANAYFKFQDAITILPGEYRLYGCPSGGSAGRYALQLYSVKADGTVGSALINDYGSSEVYRCYSKTRVMGYLVVRSGVTAENLLFRPSLVLNKLYDGAYYKAVSNQFLPINTPLCGIPVTSGGNYTDANGQQWVTDEVDFVRGMRVQRVGVKVFDGAESFSLNTTNQYYCRFVGGQKAYAECLCDVLKGSPKGGYNAQGDNVISASGTDIWVFSRVLCTSRDDIMAYFAQKYAEGNPVKLYYILETPVETPLTEEELAAYAALRTNYPNTTIYANDNAGLSVAYKADTKNYIDKKFNELAAAIVNA